MITAFESFLNELGKTLEFDMTPEENGTCSIIIDDKLVIQLESTADEKELLLISPIAEILPGAFRIKVFTNALKANNQIPKTGNFAFNDSSTELFLFEYFSLEMQDTEKFKIILELFAEKAINWKEALMRNESAPAEFISQLTPAPSPLNGPFFR